MSGPPRAYPARAVVERVIREEAWRTGARVADVIGASRKPAAQEAITAAITRIMAETGCSHRGLEQVWGSTLRKQARRPTVNGYDPSTIERLRWAHGDARTAQIVAGKDPATNADLAAWRRLGAGVRP